MLVKRIIFATYVFEGTIVFTTIIVFIIAILRTSGLKYKYAIVLNEVNITLVTTIREILLVFTSFIH